MGSSHSDTDVPRRTVRSSRPVQAWSQRCAHLFEDLRRPARAMVSRAYGKALSDEEIDDVYSAAWAATLSALRTRGEGMSDEELRAYVLTAVASHASKELRRRARKPAGSFDESHEQSMADRHQPLPEERAIGSEDRGIARDLLSSLPVRRRAVMLLRYGWGLGPTEVCALVGGLSPRAYRKEVTRGVEQLIERLRQVESGEWCESREPLLRDYVAGTADEGVQRQAREHLEHCRACSSFVARLSGHLHDLGSAIALSAVAGSIGTSKAPLIERLGGLLNSARDGAATVVEKGEQTVGAVAASGGVRGSGVAGAGVAAKLAGLGAAGKAAIACFGASAVASACVAVGVVPGISFDGSDPEPRPARAGTATDFEYEPIAGAPTPSAGQNVLRVEPEPVVEPANASPTPGDGGHRVKDDATHDVEVAPEVPTVVEEEFDPVASSAPVASAAASPAPPVQSTPGPSAGSASEAAGNEFGP